MMRRCLVLIALLAVASVAACSKPAPPITVGEGMVTVVNQTEQDWTDVLITVNDHFRGFVKVLKAEGRANAPLTQFTTGHGQRWTTGTLVRRKRSCLGMKGFGPQAFPTTTTSRGVTMRARCAVVM